MAIAWLAGTLVERGTHRAMQLETKKYEDLEARLKKHYADMIARMEKWTYQNGVIQHSGYPQISEDRKHLKSFKKLYRLYLRGLRLAKDRAERSNAKVALVNPQVKEWLKDFATLDVPPTPTESQCMTITNEVINRGHLLLEGTASHSDLDKPERVIFPSRSTMAEEKWEAYYFCGFAFRVTSDKIDSLWQNCNSLMRSDKLRDAILAEREASAKLEENKNKFDVQKASDMALVKSADYYDPRLEQVRCDGCKTIRAALDSMGVP